MYGYASLDDYLTCTGQDPADDREEFFRVEDDERDRVERRAPAVAPGALAPGQKDAPC